MCVCVCVYLYRGGGKREGEREREREMVAPLVCHGHSRPIVDINFRCVTYTYTGLSLCMVR